MDNRLQIWREDTSRPPNRAAYLEQDSSSTCSYTLYYSRLRRCEVIIDSKIKRFRCAIRVIIQRGCVCVNAFLEASRTGKRRVGRWMRGVKIWKEERKKEGEEEEKREEKKEETSTRKKKGIRRATEINVPVVDFSWRRIVHKFEAKPKFSAFRDSAIKNMNIHNAVVR